MVIRDIQGGNTKMTWMIRRNALNDFRNLQNEFNHFIGASFPRAEESVLQGSWNPAVDLAENENAIVLEADLPGVKAEDFNLSVENFVLTLSGERKFEKKSEADNYHRVERSYGSFVRSFTLPSTINVEGVKAEFKDGVLRVTLPKREEVRARQIKIDVKSEPQARTAEAK
jgi:HSP20 family protein